MKKILFILTGFSAIILLCSTVWVNLTLISPAELVLPDNIKNIAIIDRTKTDEGNKKSKVEEIITGEVFRQDEQAVRQAIDGFIYGCGGVNRFFPIRTTERYISNGTKNTFPDPISWSKVSEICSKYQCDALLSIEIFDSDFLISNNPVRVELKDENGNLRVRTEIRATGVAVINFGIRMYNPQGKVILDEYQTSVRLNWDAQAQTVQEAINKLLNKTEAVNQAGYESGKRYAERISPTYYKVTRYFYDKPKKYLKPGVRKSEVADWEGAIESWEKLLGKKRKVAGRAAFNIAVAYEVLGDLEKAKEWASKSYTEFADKKAADYYKTLSNRQKEERVVNEQLPE